MNYLKCKLYAGYGIGGKTLKWIDSFLCFRQQRVVVNGIKSGWAPILSDVPQGTVLGPLLFSSYINDITTDIDSEIMLFAGLCLLLWNQRCRGHCETSGGYRSSWVLGKEMRHEIPTSQMQYHADYKEMEKINASYNLGGTVLDNVEDIKYLGITITKVLKWNTHVSNICTKANWTLAFWQNLSACPQDVKESAYKGLGTQSWSIVVQLGTPQVYFFKRNLRRYRKRQLDL